MWLFMLFFFFFFEDASFIILHCDLAVEPHPFKNNDIACGVTYL